MKTTWILTMAVVSGLSSTPVYGKDSDRTVTVYFNHDTDVPQATVFRATALSSLIFAGIGLSVHFSANKADHLPGLKLEMYIQMEAPEEMSSKALGLSYPFRADGKIRVFYQRIQEYQPSESRSVVLAYILSHEIAHVLEGTTRHSPTGVMKAKWNREDFKKMEAARLGFNPDDVRLIRSGLEKRLDYARHASPLP